VNNDVIVFGPRRRARHGQGRPTGSSKPIERLIPYANNPRLHSTADIERLAASILKWGWTNPVLVDEQGALIAGHGRLAAAAKLGWWYRSWRAQQERGGEAGLSPGRQ
jgi:hypothetical protein